MATGLPLRADEPAAPEEGIEVQTRGPVHEAYAQPSLPNPQPGPVVHRRPPGPVPEEPPDQRPEGDNVQWVAGYWAWDVDKQDFLWVSGLWRVPPPGRRWMAGRWAEVEGGWQWTSGFWTPQDQEEVPYLSAPPPSLDVGPAVPAPDDESTYVPGSWVSRTSGYRWRPGFWQEARPGWLWNPAHYCWTPGGYVFVDGYWDYPLEDRGLAFAPVAFNEPLWQNAGWSYRPRFVLGSEGLLASLFSRPSWGHYYFGDYYDPDYARLGFQPWYQYGPRAYDPLFGYYRWAHRDDLGWFRGLRDLYRGRRNGDLVRPPRTFAAQNVLFRGRNFSRANVNLVTPLSRWRGGNRRLVNRAESERGRQRTFATQPRRRGVERSRVERSQLPYRPSRQRAGAGANMLALPRTVGRIEHGTPHQSRYYQTQRQQRLPRQGRRAFETPHAAHGARQGLPSHHAAGQRLSAPAGPRYHAPAATHHSAPAAPMYDAPSPAASHYRARAPSHHAAPSSHHSSSPAPRHQGGRGGSGGHPSSHASTKHHR